MVLSRLFVYVTDLYVISDEMFFFGCKLCLIRIWLTVSYCLVYVSLFLALCRIALVGCGCHVCLFRDRVIDGFVVRMGPGHFVIGRWACSDGPYV
ncbi:hypothetical protein HanLR1_Chr15g0569201 [Helianthus annuus]|nr:hypothetical protein HanLR1_Chr15g0569201 [Helianthus annuus]